MKKCTLSEHFLLQYSVFKLFSTIGKICMLLHCLCDHCFTGNATIQYVYIIELDVTVNSIQIWVLHKNAFVGNLCD